MQPDRMRCEKVNGTCFLQGANLVVGLHMAASSACLCVGVPPFAVGWWPAPKHL